MWQNWPWYSRTRFISLAFWVEGVTKKEPCHDNGGLVTAFLSLDLQLISRSRGKISQERQAGSECSVGGRLWDPAASSTAGPLDHEP